MGVIVAAFLLTAGFSKSPSETQGVKDPEAAAQIERFALGIPLDNILVVFLAGLLASVGTGSPSDSIRASLGRVAA